MREKGIGIGAQIIRAKARAKIGEIVNNCCEEVEGRTGSLINNFIPSAKGWKRPQGPTIFGPLRCCMYPSIFRSIRVKNATANKIGII